MIENQLTLAEQEEIFGKLTNRPGCKEERGVYGAKKFGRKVGGLLGIKRRPESEMIQLLIDMALVKNVDDAGTFLKNLKGKAVVYGGIIRDHNSAFYEKPFQAKYLRLEEIEGNGTAYRVNRWNTLPHY